MYKVIDVGGKDVPMLANAATPIRYRQLFHRNVMTFFSGKGEEEDAVDFVGELAYIMASSAAGKDMNTLSYDGYIEWLEQFEALAFADSATVEAIVNLYRANDDTQADVKKNHDRPSE